MTDSNTLSRLERWYEAQCDGDWEHAEGIEIATLDNPGWSVRISLAGTGLESRAFDPIKIERGERDWLHAWVEGATWNAAADASNLGEAVATFLEWAGD